MSIGGEQISRLEAKIPTIQDPFPALNISVPGLGCFSGDGKTYVGRKFANRPDMLKLQHLAQKIAQFKERIITQTIGKLDNPARSAGFVAQIAEIEQKISEATQDIFDTVGDIVEEINAGIQFVNDRIGELNAVRAQLDSIEPEVRSKVTAHMIERYDQYFGSLEAQANRLQSAKACVQSFLSL